MCAIVAKAHGIELILAATRGPLYNPFYETPTIRVFPYGFNHCIPRGWPDIRTNPSATIGTKMAATGRASRL